MPGSGAPQVDSATLVYDDSLGKVILFGGLGAAGAVNGTWAWDGATWEQVASTGPEPRYGALAFFDASLGRVVLFGGARTLTGRATDCGGGLVTTVNGPSWYRDTWLWDGGAWTRACDSTTSDCGTEPTARLGANVACDAARGEFVYANGINDFTDTTWTFNGRTWTALATGNPPAANYPSSAGTPNGVFRFDGLVLGTSNPITDTYRRTGTTWALQASSTAKPLGRYGAGTTWNGGAATPHLLVFGGAFNTTPAQPTCPGGFGGTFCWLSDTWGYGAWPTCTPAGSSCWRDFAATGPSRRQNAAFAALANGEAVLFGGSGPSATLADTWRWKGTAWTQVLGAGPSARGAPVSAFDARRGSSSWRPAIRPSRPTAGPRRRGCLP